MVKKIFRFIEEYFTDCLEREYRASQELQTKIDEIRNGKFYIRMSDGSLKEFENQDSVVNYLSK